MSPSSSTDRGHVHIAVMQHKPAYRVGAMEQEGGRNDIVKSIFIVPLSDPILSQINSVNINGRRWSLFYCVANKQRAD